MQNGDGLRIRRHITSVQLVSKSGAGQAPAREVISAKDGLLLPATSATVAPPDASDVPNAVAQAALPVVTTASGTHETSGTGTNARADGANRANGANIVYADDATLIPNILTSGTVSTPAAAPALTPSALSNVPADAGAMADAANEANVTNAPEGATHVEPPMADMADIADPMLTPVDDGQPATLVPLPYPINPINPINLSNHANPLHASNAAQEMYHSSAPLQNNRTNYNNYPAPQPEPQPAAWQMPPDAPPPFPPASPVPQQALPPLNNPAPLSYSHLTHVPWQAADSWGATTLNISSNTAAGASYLFWWISGLLVYFNERNNRFVRFHALQSIILTGTLTVIGVCTIFFASIMHDLALSTHQEIFTQLGLLPAVLVALGIVFCWLLPMIAAWTGHDLHMPLIGSYAERYAAPPKPLGHHPFF